MRVCVFTPNLDSLESGRDALMARVREAIGGQCADLNVAGYRRSGPVREHTITNLPYELDDAFRMRCARTLLRLVDGTSHVPVFLASLGLAWYTPAVVELIVANDPDVVVLDVRWGRLLKRALEREFAGEVYVVDDRSTTAARSRKEWRKADSGAKVSIVLPTYNGSKYLRQSIQSCLVQSFQNIELVIVDDGSAEDIRAVVEGFNDPRIRYLRHEVNRGLPEALNTGFRAASGQYLTWTSDDNYYAPDAIERMCGFLQSYPQIDFVYASCYIVDEMRPGRSARILEPLPVGYLKRDNGIGACFLYTRQVYDEIGDYNAAAFLAEDYDYWVRVSKRFRMQRIVAPLYYYRFHKDSLTFVHSRDAVAQKVDLVKRQNRIA